jgi:hypothetical protein
MRRIVKTAVVIVAIYIVLSAGLLAAMYQPPDTFGRVMAKMPRPLFFILPFKPLWDLARAGYVKPGDTAPDFSLETVDHMSRVQLSSFRGQKPVVLVFGSYT